MRVYELAKKLNIGNKELIAKLQDLGVQVTSHMNKVEEDAIELLTQEQVETKPQPAANQPEQKPEPSSEPVKESKPVAPAETIQEPVAPPPAPEPEPETPPPAPEDEPEEEETDSAAPKNDKTISIKGHIVVRELAKEMGLKPNQLITELMMLNVLASINERLDIKIAQQIAEKHGFSVEYEKRGGVEPPKPRAEEEEIEEDSPETLKPRPPVITFLGHIDHGKTSLLDYIRKSAVASKEAGGITQHIGAYMLEHNGQKITFLDTPGHAAFTAMRARGADLTDIAVIVIAADDGIMPQTAEAIQHARAAGTTIVIAINKTDVPGANIDMVKQQLQADDLTPEDWGGTTICCPVSAKTGDGMDAFIEMLLLQAEMLELTANPSRRAEGYVIESRLETGMGATATLLVTRGTLKVGDAVVCGPYWGKIKALVNENNKNLKSAGPSTPVKCLGLSGVPNAGEKFVVCTGDKKARSIADERATDLRQSQLATPRKKASLEDLLAEIQPEKELELPLIIKCDTQGSLEAIQKCLDEIKTDKVKISVIMSGVGNVTENDVLLASASKAIVAGFHVGKGEGVLKAQKAEGVEVRLYDIIYKFVEEVEEAMSGMLSPITRERLLGKAEVRQVFNLGKKGNAAGCLAIEGKLNNKALARVRRKNEVVYEGSVNSLRRFQDEVTEVREGQECGIRLTNYSQFEQGDVIEFFQQEKIPQKL